MCWDLALPRSEAWKEQLCDSTSPREKGPLLAAPVSNVPAVWGPPVVCRAPYIQSLGFPKVWGSPIVTGSPTAHRVP